LLARAHAYAASPDAALTPPAGADC
jgi:hypothetical protein